MVTMATNNSKHFFTTNCCISLEMRFGNRKCLVVENANGRVTLGVFGELIIRIFRMIGS